MKQRIIYILIGTIIGIMLSYYYDKSNKYNPVTVKETKIVSLDTLKHLVVFSGDTSAYRELAKYYSKTPFPQELFLYAFVMKYHYGYQNYMEGTNDSLRITK